jgi:hypothetical protein
MANRGTGDREADGNQEKTDNTQGFDPRDTEHPAGEEQAAQNAAEDPPS